MRQEKRYSKIFKQADEVYISDDGKRVYNVIANEFITSTQIQVYEFDTRKRTFISFSTSYTLPGGYWYNGVHYNGTVQKPYYYPEFISIYYDEESKKVKEVGSGVNLPEKIWDEMMELVNEKFGDINMYLSHIYGKCKSHKIYSAEKMQNKI